MNNIVRFKEKRNRALKGLCCLLVSLAALLGAFPFTATASYGDSKVIRIGYYQNDGFQDYDEETGVYSGYSYEFFMALQQYTDWSYEFVPCGFSEGLSMLQNGELDLMNNVSKTAEREQVLGFSTIAAGENIAYLAMKSGDTRVALDDLKAMETIKIGLAEDSIYSERLVEYFEDNGVSADISWYPSRDEVTAAFQSGEVDAYVITSSTKTDEHIILSFAPDSYYLATTKGNDELIREIDSAIIALRANDPYFELHLKEKYYGQTTENYTVLTGDEQAYLAENPVARVLYQPDWYPLCYQDENGDFAGAIRGVYDLLEKRTGIKFEYVPVDSENGSNSITEGYNAQIMAEQPADFSGAGVYDVKLTKSFISPPLMEVANHILVPGDTVALVEGDYLSEICQKVYGEEYNYVFCGSVVDCIEAVRKNEADGTVLISYESEFYRQQRKYSGLTYTIVDEGSYSLAIAVSNEADPRLYSIIQKGLNSISTGEISNVFNKTLLSLQKNDFFTVIYDNPVPALIILAALLTLVISIIFGQIFIRKLKGQNVIINEKNEALQRANRATTNFFSRMSHDMRTPMNGILGMARLSKEESDPEILRRNIGKIEASGEYLLSLINDTLDFRRIESGKMQLKPESVRGSVIARDIESMIRPAVEKKHIALRTVNKSMDTDHFIMADPVRIKQIFLNLLSNAVKFTPEGGTVQVEYECLWREGMVSHCRFLVRDTGIGMSAEFIQNSMFKPFSQEQNEVTGQYAGSGLGLSIVKSLVELMGGSISVESELGAGTAFTICLDFERVNEAEAESAIDSRSKRQNSVAQCLKGKRILLAEDHPLNAEIAGRLLERVQCAVTWAHDGRECADIFAASAEDFFDAILMDIRMPVLNGLEAAAEIRRMPRADAKTVPIIAMTANAYEDDIKMSIGAGMNAHLAKPIEPAKLYQTLAEAVEGREGGSV